MSFLTFFRARVGRTLLIAIGLVLGTALNAAVPMPPCIEGGNCNTGPEPYPLGNVPFPYSWPASPQNASGNIQNISSISALQSAVRQSNQTVQVAPGLSLNGGLSITGTDLIINVPNSTTINGSISFSGQRVQWRGGNMRGGPLEMGSGTDIWIDNLNAVTTVSRSNNFLGTNQRVAITNSTIHHASGFQGSWTMFFIQNNPHRDIILANVRMTGSGVTAVARLQSIENLIIVDSAINMDGGSGTGLRIHDRSTNVLVRDTLLRDAWQMNYSQTGEPRAPDVLNLVAENVTRYDNQNFIATFDGSSSPQPTGSINRSPLYNSSGLNVGGEAYIGPMSGSGNEVRSWDGSTTPDVSGVGADH